MLDLTRLTGSIDQIESDFVEREVAPEPLMKLSVQIHTVGLPPSYTVSFLYSFGVKRAQSAIHK